MGLRTLLLDLSKDRGIEIDPDELDSIGLSDEDVVEKIASSAGDKEVLSAQLPGSASGLAEIFLAAPKGKVVEANGLLWSPIGMEGQWATRPDGRGGKVKAPLKLIAGRSKSQRKQIGMQDIVDAFDDGAVESVTIPTTHNNGPLENTGFVEKLAIVDAKTKRGGTVKVLMSGERYTDLKAKQKVKEGSTPGRSMGLLYDYTRTDSAKTYGVALEHVALTPKPWLRGMPRLARPLSDPAELSTVSLSLSDDGPSEADLETMLVDAVSEDDSDFLAEPAVQWNHEDSPQWLRQQVNDILSEARRKKVYAKRSSAASLMVDDPTPCYRAVEAKPGSALIADGYGDGSNYWVAGITVADGKVSLADFKDWSSTKQVWVSDVREQPTGDQVPLSDVEVVVRAPNDAIDPLLLAQDLRRALSPKVSRLRADTTDLQDPNPNNEPPRGGGEVDGQKDGTLQLSDEARALIKAAEDRAAAAEAKTEKLSETVDKLLGTSNANAAAAFITSIKAPISSGGLGLSEDLGWGGMLVEIEQIMLADDGGPAVRSDHFADEKTNPDGTLTVSDAIKRVFGALRTKEGVILKLGEVVEEPVVRVDGKDGKPPKDDSEVDESMLSDEEILARIEKEHPGKLGRAGVMVPIGSTNGDGKGAS